VSAQCHSLATTLTVNRAMSKMLSGKGLAAFRKKRRESIDREGSGSGELA